MKNKKLRIKTNILYILCVLIGCINIWYFTEQTTANTIINTISFILIAYILYIIYKRIEKE